MSLEEKNACVCAHVFVCACVCVAYAVSLTMVFKRMWVCGLLFVCLQVLCVACMYVCMC